MLIRKVLAQILSMTLAHYPNASYVFGIFSCANLLIVDQISAVKLLLNTWVVQNNITLTQPTRLSLFQIMARRLFAPKPLSEQMEYNYRTISNTFQWNLNSKTCIFIKEMHLKMLYGKWRPFCLGHNVLSRLCHTPNASSSYDCPLLVD